MKTYIISILITAVSMSSCDRDDDRIDFYKSQHRSEELNGWWKRISNEAHPDYMFFDTFTYKSLSYSESLGYYNPAEGDYWYNNDSYIFSLSVGNFKSSGVENKSSYKLNNTKDTLRLGSNPPAYFVKSTQP